MTWHEAATLLAVVILILWTWREARVRREARGISARMDYYIGKWREERR